MGNSKPLLTSKRISIVKQDYKSSIIVYSLAMSLLLGGVIFGYNLAVFNAQVEFMASRLNWTKPQETFYTSIMTSVVLFGAIFGVIITWSLSEYCSRKQSIIILDLLFIIGGLLTNFRSEFLIILGRIIIGLGIGICSHTIPIFLREISPNSMRGKLGGFWEASIVFGQLISYTLGLGIPSKVNGKYENLDNQWWRFMFLLTVFAACLQIFLISIVFNIESPLYLYMHGQHELCKKALSRVYLEEKVDGYLKDLEVEKQNYDEQKKVTVQSLWKNYRKQLIYSCLILAFAQCAGNTVISEYADTLFRRNANHQISDLVGRLLTSFFILLKLTFVIVASFLSDTHGRKGLVLIGTAGVCFCHFSLSFVQGYHNFFLTTTLLDMFIICFSLSLGPFPYVFVTETLPARGVTLAMIDSWIFSFLNTFAFPYLVQFIGYSGVYLYYAILTTFCFIFIYFFVPELSNLTREEIQKKFSQNDSKDFEEKIEMRKLNEWQEHN